MAELLKFNTIVGAKHLSIILGIGERRIQQLCDVGVLEKEGRGKFDIAKCVQAFISYKLDEKNDTGEESAYEQEKTKLTRAKRMIEEKKLQIMSGELHRSATVQAVMARMLSNFKGKLQALPIKVASKLLGETQLVVIQDVILDEVTECLTELSDYDPNLFYDESEDIVVMMMWTLMTKVIWWLKMDSITQHTVNLFKGVMAVIKPPPKFTASEWSNANVVLSTEDSAKPGKYSTDRAPYQKEMLDAVSQPDVEMVVYMTGSQVGKTQLIKNILGYFIDYYPSPIMYMMPILDLAKEYSKNRIAPFIRDTKVLDNKMADPNVRDGGNTTLTKTFLGGYLSLVGANSPAGLASRPIRVLLADEIDRYPLSAGTEGDPLSLAEKRTNTFYNRKHIYASTPLAKGTSRIEKLYLNGTQEVWHIKCPQCGDYVYPSWDRFVPDEEAGNYYMACDHCGGLSEEIEWKRLFKYGKWVVEAPDNLAKHHCRSFHMNAFASPWASWEKLQLKYEEAQQLGDVGLKTFFNTEMGVPYEADTEALQTDELYARKEEYGAELPEGVLMLTAGVDTQDDRLEVEVVGWGKEYESWGIEYIKLYGDPAYDAVWEALDDVLLYRKWPFADGRKRGVSTTCIDSGGNKTQAVYKYCSARVHNRIYPIKGVGGAGKDIIDGLPTKLKKYKAHLFKLGVDTGKELIYSDLKQERGAPRYCHFPKDYTKGYGKQYFDGLLAEMKVSKLVNGRYKESWVLRPGKKRNEPFDVRNYNIAAVTIVSPNFEALEMRDVKDEYTPYQATTRMVKAGTTQKRVRKRRTKGGIKL